MVMMKLKTNKPNTSRHVKVSTQSSSFLLWPPVCISRTCMGFELAERAKAIRVNVTVVRLEMLVALIILRTLS